jgi:ATP-dependent Zn protease
LDEITYKFLLLKTRIALAGRAAEELFFGGLNISSGANSDLSSATRMCFRLFAYSGFHSQMDGQAISASNLAVLNKGEVDPLQYERVSKDVRNFLEDQYLYVMNTLKEKRAFVDAVAQRLLWDPVVDQQEMKALSEQHGIPIAKH